MCCEITYFNISFNKQGEIECNLYASHSTAGQSEDSDIRSQMYRLFDYGQFLWGADPVWEENLYCVGSEEALVGYPEEIADKES